MKISKQKFLNALTAAGIEDRVRFDYPWTSGKTCPGIVGGQSDFRQFMFYLGAITWDTDDEEPACDALREACTDSMGYDTIFYFPNLEFGD